MQGVGTYGETNHGQLLDPAPPRQALNTGLALWFGAGPELENNQRNDFSIFFMSSLSWKGLKD